MTKGFAQVPNEVLTDSKLSAIEKIVYALILGKCNKEGYCWASNETLGEWAGCSERWIRQSLSNLKKLNYIKTEQKNVKGKTERKIFPLIVVQKQEELQFQTRRTYSSSNNTSSLKEKKRANKKSDDFNSLLKPQRPIGTEPLNEDKLYKATNGLYDIQSLREECKFRWPGVPMESTELYKAALLILTNKKTIYTT